jgi:hypothetical protein
VKVAVATAPAAIVPVLRSAASILGRVTGGRAGGHVADGVGAVAARGQRHPSAVTVMTARSAHRASLAAGAPSLWRGVVPAGCATIGSCLLVLVSA